DELVLVVRACDPGQRPDFRIRELAFGERTADRRQGFQRMRDPHLLARGAERDIAAVVQPLGAAREAPSEPAHALVEAADEHEEVIGRGVDAESSLSTRPETP